MHPSSGLEEKNLMSDEQREEFGFFSSALPDKGYIRKLQPGNPKPDETIVNNDSSQSIQLIL